MRAAALVIVLLLSLLSAGVAQADLGSDAERLTLAWSAFGRVKRMQPRLLERGDVLPFLLPAEVTDPTTKSCVSVAILAPTSINFVVEYFGDVPDGDPPESSLAGAVQVTRCGAHKAALDYLALEM